MATIKTDLICNLNQPVNVTYLHGNLFSQDNAGNTINVFVMDNGEPATIGGTVSANVIRSDGQTVAVSGAIEGNKAYVILPQACYAVPGVVHIIIKLTQSTTVTTIAAVVANVYMSTTDAVIDPGTVIPSIQALMALIEEAVDSIPTDYTGLLHTIAADYSSSKTYKVGDYAWESGVLKRCIVPITAAETYTAAHWTNAVIGDDLTNLKSALSDRTLFADTAFSESIFQLRKGSAVNSAGRYASDSNAVAGYGSEKCPFVHAGTKITANEGYKFSYALWDIPVSANANVSHNIIVVRDIAAGTTVTIPQDAYIAFSCKKADDSALPSDKTAYEFANEAVTVELYIRTSKTEINKMEEQITTQEGIINAVNSWVGKNNNPVASLAGCFILSKNVCKNTDYTDGYYIKPDGSLVANASFKVSDYFMVEPNTQYYLYNSSSTIVFYDLGC